MGPCFDLDESKGLFGVRLKKGDHEITRHRRYQEFMRFEERKKESFLNQLEDCHEKKNV